MTSIINKEAAAKATPLVKPHYPFPRGEELREALSWCVTDYFVKASIGKDFEARGLIVTGESRVGKTTEIKRLLAKLNAGSELMPDGRPARIVHILLTRKDTWKGLGGRTLEAFGYPMEGRRTQAYIWGKVIDQARRQGVVGIHFDECQHVFTDEGKATHRQFLDSFKTLLKDSRWPLMLILSGVPDLLKHVQAEEQLARLLRPVHFDLIRLPDDLDEMNRLAYAFADLAGLNFDPLSNIDFFRRLNHACARRWGLVIELLIQALTIANMENASDCSVDHFVAAFAKLYGLPEGYSPFTVPDYEECFDQTTLLDLLN